MIVKLSGGKNMISVLACWVLRTVRLRGHMSVWYGSYMLTFRLDSESFQRMVWSYISWFDVLTLPRVLHGDVFLLGSLFSHAVLQIKS